MKKITQFLSAVLLLACVCSASAQAPQKFNYQAVVRDGSGNVVANQTVGIRVSIHESTANGTVVYQETQTVVTNQFGLITLQIGAGTPSNAAFTSVDWSKKAKYIQMEIDAEGGTNYTDIGATELISVPYALYAENAGGSVSSKDSVPVGAFGQTLRYDTVGVDRWVANSFLYNNGTRLGIGTASPLCRLHVADGALIVTGTSGSTPISGAGTRLMWIPPKKAFRAGTVTGNQWDDANLGLSSASVGEDNIASGTYSVAFGRQDSATGSNSTAIGFRNLASNTGAVAFGGNNKATGYYSFTAGNMNKPSGQYATTLGYSNMASADYAVAMGKTTVASGQYALALGYLTQATGNYSFAQGKSTIASGVYSMASGEGSVAGKNNCVSFGYYNAANGMYSVAMGIYTYARAYASTVFGKHNIISGDSTAWIATDPIFVIGNGTAVSRSNALTVLKNGNTGIGTATPEAALDVASTTSGFLMPRLTTTQRNAISSPVQAMQIFNLTTNCFETFNYGTWIDGPCYTCPAPAAPTEEINIPSYTEIIWKWNTVPYTAGYKWNTTNDYNTATDNGTDTTYTQTGLTSGEPYTLYVWSYNSCGNNSSETVLTDTTLWTCGISLLNDSRDAKSYTTVQIGTQCWMKQNLDYGTAISTGSQQTDNLAAEKYCYQNNPGYCTTYGGLYQWAEAVQYLNGATNNTSWNPVPVENVQGICPAGWHLPTDNEKSTLENYLGGISVAGGHLKETGTSHWNGPNYGADNSSGFTGLPGGYVYGGGSYTIKYLAYFWTSTESSASGAWYRALRYDYATVTRDNDFKSNAFSVRCLKD